MDDKEFVPFIQEVENEIYLSLKKDLYRKMKEISNFAVESFRKQFWYDEGIPRNWNQIDEGEINTLYAKFLKENYFVFDLFKTFNLLRNPLKCKINNLIKFIFVIFRF